MSEFVIIEEDGHELGPVDMDTVLEWGEDGRLDSSDTIKNLQSGTTYPGNDWREIDRSKPRKKFVDDVIEGSEAAIKPTRYVDLLGGGIALAGLVNFYLFGPAAGFVWFAIDGWICAAILYRNRSGYLAGAIRFGASSFACVLISILMALTKFGGEDVDIKFGQTSNTTLTIGFYCMAMLAIATGCLWQYRHSNEL